MKRKSLLVLIALMLMLSLVPLSASAETESLDNVTAATIRSLDKKLPNVPIGKTPIPATAKTPPPPEMVSPLSFIDPSFNYLLLVSAYIDVQSNGKLTITGDTYATQEVDEISIKLTLERWTGTEWVTSFSDSAKSSYQTDNYYYTKSNLTSASGYYYRTKMETFVSEGGFKEGVTAYSGFTLAP